jgi:hypothetical protein
MTLGRISGTAVWSTRIIALASAMLMSIRRSDADVARPDMPSPFVGFRMPGPGVGDTGRARWP